MLRWDEYNLTFFCLSFLHLFFLNDLEFWLTGIYCREFCSQLFCRLLEIACFLLSGCFVGVGSFISIRVGGLVSFWTLPGLQWTFIHSLELTKIPLSWASSTSLILALILRGLVLYAGMWSAGAQPLSRLSFLFFLSLCFLTCILGISPVVCSIFLSYHSEKLGLCLSSDFLFLKISIKNEV